MIELIVIGHRLSTDGSEELHFGWQSLQRQLPASATLIRTSAKSLEALWLEAILAAQQQPNCSNGNAQVLLLAHPHVSLAPGTLEALSQQLSSLPTDALCWAYDSNHPVAHAPLNYCTLRGIERYADLLNAANAQAGPAHDGLLLFITQLATLQKATPLNQAQSWGVEKAFAHDFSNYHSGLRDEVIHMVPSSCRKVLDVGGGEGGFLEALKKSHSCETHLAEFSIQACEVARGRVDKVWQGDFLKSSIDEVFDCITFLDVLEHTADPLSWLVRAGSMLAPNGCIVTSIPNVGHWSVIADLLEGRWDYAPVGIHCITHLRFFTRHGIEELFRQAGFEIEHIEATVVEPPIWWQTSGMQAATGHALRIQPDNLSAYAYLVRAKPMAHG